MQVFLQGFDNRYCKGRAILSATGQWPTALGNAYLIAEITRTRVGEAHVEIEEKIAERSEVVGSCKAFGADPRSLPPRPRLSRELVALCLLSGLCSNNQVIGELEDEQRGGAR